MTDYAASDEDEWMHEEACERVNKLCRLKSLRTPLGQPDYDKIAEFCEHTSRHVGNRQDLGFWEAIDEVTCWQMAADLARERQAQRDVLVVGSHEREFTGIGL